MSNMEFKVSPYAIIAGIINGEIQARMYCKHLYPEDLEGRKRELKKYRKAGIVSSSLAIVNFMRQHRRVFKNPKLVSQEGNIFEEMITLALQAESKEDYDQKLKSRMTIGHGLTSEEMEGMDEFLNDFHSLQNAPDIKTIIERTKQYRTSVERLWITNEEAIIKHIEEILRVTPEIVGDACVYLMYPNYDTHRSCQTSKETTSLVLGKRGKGTENKILAHLAHQAVHQPRLPYKMFMCQKDKKKFDAFIKFLTDKEIYANLSGESSLGITTPQENHELMGKIYPYWLGYRFRNAKEPAREIGKVIQTDMIYLDSLPEKARARRNYSHYKFEELDPEKIAEFFRYKKGMTPYEFIKIDFDNRDNVCKEAKKDKGKVNHVKVRVREDR